MAHRILVVTQQCTYPTLGGAALRVWQTINLLGNWGDVTVFSLFQGEFCPPSSSYVNWCHVNLNGVTRTPIDKLRRRWHEWRHTSHPRVDWLYTQAGKQQLQAVLRQVNPTLIVVSEIWLYGYLTTLERWGCPIIFEHHNIEGDDRRYRDDRGQLTLPEHRLQGLRAIEMDFVKRVAQTWVCSAADAAEFVRLYGAQPGPKLVSVANGVDADYYRCRPSLPQDVSLLGDRSILFLGRFSYGPNAEAADSLIHKIYPLLKRNTPTCQLWLVGCDPTEAMVQAAQTDADIVVTGAVEDVRSYLNKASIMVVPLYRGSGTRLKLIEAMAAQCPIVTTSKGAEGIMLNDGEQGFVRESPGAMAAAVETLWQQPQMAQQFAQAAHGIFLDHYSWSAVSQQMGRALALLS